MSADPVATTVFDGIIRNSVVHAGIGVVYVTLRNYADKCVTFTLEKPEEWNAICDLLNMQPVKRLRIEHNAEGLRITHRENK